MTGLGSVGDVNGQMSRWEDIEGFILDLDGTVYLGDSLLPGSARFFQWMVARGKRSVVLTNNSSQNAKGYLKKLQGMGLPVTASQIITSGQVTAAWMKRHHPDARTLILGTEKLVDEFRSAGLAVVREGEEELEAERGEVAEGDGEDYGDARDPDIIVVGFDTTLTYAKLERVCLLIRSGVPYYATHPDDVCPTPRGLIPDCGAIVALIKTATGCNPQRVFGKPGPEMVAEALARLELPAAEVAMVGDRLYTDVRMARDNGLLAVLVLSGETDREMLAASELEPDLVVQDLGELCGPQ